jgi:hypothetical protein
MGIPLSRRVPPSALRIIRPTAAPGPLANPLKGWCPYTIAGPITQPYSMVFQYVSWRELEPKPEDYRFAEWEQRAWDVPLARGKQIIFRVYVDYPKKQSGLPDWLRAAGVPTRPYTDYGGGVAPDYDDPRCLEAMERLIAALGQRYNTHPRVAFVEMGLLGFWGEWHTYPRPELFASAVTQRRVLEAARRAFPNKMVMTRYPQGWAGQQPWLGFFDDMFPEDTDGPEDWKFLPKMRRAGRTDNWKRAVIGGEMVPDAAARWLGEDFAQTMRRMEAAHFTWVGPYCPAQETPPSPRFLSRSQEMVRRMGYQFQLTEIRHSAEIGRDRPLEIEITGRNTGVAPFYYAWPVELALLDAGKRVVARNRVPVDIRTWLPGAFTVRGRVPLQAKPGSYTLAIGIPNPWTSGPSIRFANALPEHQEWTLLSDCRVSGG